MINLDELIYSYRYVKGMVRRVERELDDDYGNLSTLEIYNKQSDLHGLYKTMEELSKKINVIKKNAIKADLVKATITTNKYLLSFNDDYIESGKVFISIKNDTNYIVTIPEDTRWFFIDDVDKDKAEEFRNK